MCMGATRGELLWGRATNVSAFCRLQSVPEQPEAAAVETIQATENGIADDAPMSPPPAVPVEATQQAPAITEDVASVTKVKDLSRFSPYGIRD